MRGQRTPYYPGWNQNSQFQNSYGQPSRYPQHPYLPYQGGQSYYSGPQGMHQGQMAAGSPGVPGPFPYPYYPQQEQGIPNHNMQPPIFENPLQPLMENKGSSNHPSQPANPYPKGNYTPRPPQGGFNNIMNSFKSQDGSLDFNKMVNTAGQMMNAVNQVSNMVKGLGGIFKA